MQSFTLNRLNPEESFLCSSENSEFVLIEVIIDNSSHNLEIKELQKLLSGFYLEVEEVYDLNEKVIRSRCRPFELLKEIDSSNNAVYFNRTISNELFNSDGVNVFYNKLNIKLISRYSSQYDLSFKINYEGKEILQIKS